MNLILKVKDAGCTRWNKTKQKPPFQNVVCSPQGELHSKTTLALLCAYGFSYSSPRFLHPATCKLRCNAEFKEGVGLGVYPWVSIISGQPCISMPSSIKGQRAPNGRLYFGEPIGLWEVHPQPGKEGTMGPGEIVLVTSEFNLQNSCKNSEHSATHV